jgi:hypothetical protein
MRSVFNKKQADTDRAGRALYVAKRVGKNRVASEDDEAAGRDCGAQYDQDPT